MPKPAELRFNDITIGMRAKFTVVLTAAMVAQFAELSGDYNPLHADEAYAKETSFGGTIAHGMLGAGFFSRLVGMHLPGRYALYLSQKSVFKKPCREGMTLEIIGEVTGKTDAMRTIFIRTQILDAENDECLIDGEAMVKVLQ